MKFILAGTPRSGSTWLQTMLCTVPGLHCGGELLGYPNLYSPQFTDPLSGLMEFWSLTKIFRSVGFRFFYWQSNYAVINTALKSLISSNDLKVIFLWRQNLFELVTSWEIAKSDGVWSVTDDRKNNATRLSKPPEFYESKFFEIENGLKSVRELFIGHQFINITYEELVENPVSQVNKIADFLECPHISEIFSNQRKKETRPPQDIHDNYNELRNHFSKSRWETFFNYEINFGKGLS